MPRPFFQSRHRVPDFTVDAAAAGASLPDALAMRWPSVHRVALRQLVEAGRVRVNGMEPQLRRALREGDYVAVDAEIDALPVFRAPTPTLTVLAENEWIVVVDKPAGTPTIPDRSGKQLGVHGELAALRPEADLRIVHRLDRDTSGCLLLGKGIDAARHLDEAFRDRRVGKCYLALVHGVVAGETRTVTNWLGPDRKRPGKVVVTKPGARGARDAAGGPAAGGGGGAEVRVRAGEVAPSPVRAPTGAPAAGRSRPSGSSPRSSRATRSLSSRRGRARRGTRG